MLNMFLTRSWLDSIEGDWFSHLICAQFMYGGVGELEHGRTFTDEIAAI